MENTRTETSTGQVENEKTAHIGVIKEGLEPCDVFDFMGGEIKYSWIANQPDAHENLICQQTRRATTLGTPTHCLPKKAADFF